MLSTAKTTDLPDERQILISRLTTAIAADYLSSAPPLSLSVNQKATIKRQTQNFLNKLALTHNGQMDSSGGIRVQNTFSQAPHKWRTRPTVVQERPPTELMKGGNSVSNFQGCHFSDESLPTTAHFNILSNKEKTRDRRVPPCDQPKVSKQISSEGEVRNGGALYAARSLLRKGDYMMKLDLNDAYYAVPIHPESRKYLQLQFKGTTYKFRCLPFGLSLASSSSLRPGSGL